MPTQRDFVLASLDRARTRVNGLGFRTFTLTVRRERYSGPIALGVTLQSVVTSLLITPSPKVERMADADASYYAGLTPPSDATGDLTLEAYAVSGITPAYNTGTVAGGLTVAQLLPVPADTRERSVILMTGPGIRTGGAPYRIIEPKFSDPFEYSFVLIRDVIHALPYP
jgi:hypothetical protein